MVGGQWEVVGGKSKKSKPKNGMSKAVENKKRQDSFNFETKGPICESQTIYDVFIEKEEKDNIPKQKTALSKKVKNKDKDKNVLSKKKKDKKATPSKLTTEDLFKEICEEEFKNLLAMLEAVCPDSRLVWLKDMVTFFNVKLDIAVEDPTFSEKQAGYPCCLLNKGIYSLILKTFKRCTPQVLELFFEHSLQNMVSDSLKGVHTLGYRIILQCLAQEMPSIVIKNLSKCIDLCNSHHNRQNICLSVMWIAGQAGNNDLEAGFQIWTEFMFSLMGTKGCTSYVVEYLEKLVSSEKLSTIKKSIIDVKSLFHILDFIHSKDLVKNIQKRLILLYPTLKSLSYGPDLETSLHNYFPSYLHRLDSKCSQSLRDEILNSLIHCLEKDVRSYSIWRQLYSKHFNQSTMLIAHINENWETLSAKLPRKFLLDTLSVFQVTNEELFISNKKSAAVKECVLINKELLAKIHAQKLSWKKIALFTVLLFLLVLAGDIFIHNSFKESVSGKYMEKVGFLAICTQAGEKLSYYYGKMYKLLQTYVPTLVVWMQQNVNPHLERFLKELVSAISYLWDMSLPVRLLLNENIRSLLYLIDAQAPVYGNLVISTFKECLLFMSEHFRTAINFLVEISENVILWLQSNAVVINLVESVQTYSVKFVTSLQEYATTGLQLLWN